MATPSNAAGQSDEPRPKVPSSLGKGSAAAAESKHHDETKPAAGSHTEMPATLGRYRVLKKLGGGGMGAVYLVENTELQRQEALKVPHFDGNDDPQVRERFLREARSAAKLDHPNLCPVYDVGVLDGIYFMTMRYLKGKPLSDYAGQPQPVRKAVEIVTKLAQALEVAHVNGVIHRDLKPSNVIMCAGTGPTVMDFGLAKQIRQQDDKLTQAGTMLGTPSYMPPEQVRGELDKMGPASDVYSLGVMLFELLTGTLPFTGAMGEVFGKILYTEAAAPSSLRPELPTPLDSICLKAMAKDLAARYPTMKGFAAILISILKTLPATGTGGSLVPSAATAPSGIFQADTVAPANSSGTAPAAGSVAPTSSAKGSSGVLQAKTVPPMQSAPSSANRKAPASSSKVSMAPSVVDKPTIPPKSNPPQAVVPDWVAERQTEVQSPIAPSEPAQSTVAKTSQVSGMPPVPAEKSQMPIKAPPRSVQRRSMPPEVPVAIADALCNPSEPRSRRLVTLTCLALSVILLASSTVLATWKLRKRVPEGSAPTVAKKDETKPARVASNPDQPKPVKPPEPPPSANQLFGGIEIGSKGIKAVVVRVKETDKKATAYEIVAQLPSAKTTLVTNLKETGILDLTAMQETVSAVTKYHERFQKDHGLPPERTFILASPGVFAVLENKNDLIATNKKHLSDAVRKATGKEIEYLDTKQELELTFRAMVPPNELDDALMIDIGSGAARAGYSEGTQTPFIAVSLPFGSSALADAAERRVKERGGNFLAQLDFILKDSDETRALRDTVQRKPGFSSLKRVYLTGGATWALATISRPDDRAQYVSLAYSDIESLSLALEKSPGGEIPEPKWKADPSPSVSQAVKKDMIDIKKTFPRERLLAGMKILQVFGTEFRLDRAGKQLLFIRDAHLAPMIGYAMSGKVNER